MKMSPPYHHSWRECQAVAPRDFPIQTRHYLRLGPPKSLIKRSPVEGAADHCEAACHNFASKGRYARPPHTLTSAARSAKMRGEIVEQKCHFKFYANIAVPRRVTCPRLAN